MPVPFTLNSEEPLKRHALAAPGTTSEADIITKIVECGRVAFTEYSIGTCGLLAGNVQLRRRRKAGTA